MQIDELPLVGKLCACKMRIQKFPSLVRS